MKQIHNSQGTRASSSGGLGWLALAGLIIFLVSVLSFKDTRAQSLSLTDQQSLMEMYRHKQTAGAHDAPETYRSPVFEVPDSLAGRLYESRPKAKADSDEAAPIPEEVYYDDSLPKPGGELQRFGADFFASGDEPYHAPVGPVSPSYRLGPGDRLYVTVWGRVNLEYDLAVDPTGRVYVPKVGAVRAFGLSLADFETRLRDRLKTIYSDFEMSVTVSQIRAVQVHVYGEARRPGSYTLNALSTLLNVLTAAGGPNERGSFRQIKLIRRAGENRVVDLYRFFASGDLNADIPVQDGDIVFIPVTGPQVKIRGEVRRPGIYELSGEERLRDLIELAGGARPEAYLGRVMVDRYDPGDQRKVLDCNLTDSGLADTDNIDLEDGDDVSIYRSYDARENVVWISGAVKHPGGYEHRDGMKAYQLIEQAGGLVPEAYTHRAHLERRPANARRSLVQLCLDSVLADSLSGPELLPRDRIVVYNRSHLERPRAVKIEGAVKSPGTYDLFDKMRLSDLVFRAGNPNRSAYLYRAEIARLQPDGGTDIVYADLQKVLDDPLGPDDPLLAEDDQIYIREIPRWRGQELVKVEGEVMFPGTYALAGANETLWDMLKRAGGLTQDAFIQGTVFVRAAISKDIQRADYARVVESSVELREDSTGVIKPAFPVRFDPDRMTRLVIDMEELMSSQGERADVTLQPGDHIYIPKRPSGVQVMGAVAAPGSILYEPGRKPKDYIKRAGGFTNQSQKGGIRLIKADGRVFAGGDAGGRRVNVGDAIFVPQEIKKEHDWWRIATGSVSIITGLVTTALLVDRL